MKKYRSDFRFNVTVSSVGFGIAVPFLSGAILLFMGTSVDKQVVTKVMILSAVVWAVIACVLWTAFRREKLPFEDYFCSLWDRSRSFQKVVRACRVWVLSLLGVGGIVLILRWATSRPDEQAGPVVLLCILALAYLVRWVVGGTKEALQEHNKVIRIPRCR